MRRSRIRLIRCSSAFTLVEVLVALSILAILSMMSFMGVTSMIASEAHLRESATRLRAIERLFAEFENDVLFAIPRGAWNAKSEFEPAISAQPERRQTSGYRISFSHFSGMPDVPPYRVSYVFSPPNVDLLIQSQLDLTADNVTKPVTVLEGLRGVAVRFLSVDDRWSESWPPAGSAPTALPRAVELTLDIEGLGPVTRLVARP